MGTQTTCIKLLGNKQNRRCGHSHEPGLPSAGPDGGPLSEDRLAEVNESRVPSLESLEIESRAGGGLGPGAKVVRSRQSHQREGLWAARRSAAGGSFQGMRGRAVRVAGAGVKNTEGQAELVWGER